MLNLFIIYSLGEMTYIIGPFLGRDRLASQTTSYII